VIAAGMRRTFFTGALLAFGALGAATAENLPAELKGVSEEPASKKFSVPTEALVRLLEERQRELDRREAAVRREEERLKLLRSDLEGLLKKQIKQPRAGAPAAAQTTATSVPTQVPNLVLLTQAFETMPVEEAAQRIDKMNESVALDLMARLKSKTAGQILAALNPAKAARLVEKLASDRQRASGK
jgi:flagellar motility protein MotE (MotC chaperone)